MLVTNHAVEWVAQLRERQRVRGCAGENKINIAVGLKDFTDSITHARSPAVLAIGWRVLQIGFLQCAAQTSGQIGATLSLANSWRSTVISLVCYASFCAGS